MKRLFQLTLAGFCVLAPSLAGERETITVSGRVFSPDGEALYEYDISTEFTWEDGQLVYESPFEIDDEGHFTARLEPGEEDPVVVIYSKNQRYGAVHRVRGVGDDSLRIHLEPTVRVKGEVTCEELDSTPEWFNVYWKIHESYPIGLDSTQGSFDLRLPVGFWEYDLYDSWFSSIEGELPLDGRLPTVNLGKLNLPAAYIAKNRGKVLDEWSPTASKNIKLQNASLQALRGKWLLVEFWGHQWETCTQDSLPELARFYRKHKTDEFEIIAFHDNTVRGFVQLDRALADVKRRHWGGEDLPFPVLIDGNGETFYRYGIEALPTTILIDPEGRLVGLGNLDLLRDALAGRLDSEE